MKLNNNNNNKNKNNKKKGATPTGVLLFSVFVSAKVLLLGVEFLPKWLPETGKVLMRMWEIHNKKKNSGFTVSSNKITGGSLLGGVEGGTTGGGGGGGSTTLAAFPLRVFTFPTILVTSFLSSINTGKGLPSFFSSNSKILFSRSRMRS